MAKVKIKHGLAFYLNEDGHQLTAFRTQVIDVSSKEAERLKTLGAAVDADDELPMVGRITPLPNTASDEELLAWVSVASRAEVAQAIADHPDLGDRILSAHTEIQRRMEAQQELLSGLSDDIKRAQEEGKKRAEALSVQSAPTGQGQQGQQGGDPEDLIGDGGGDGDGDHDDLDEIVKGNVESVSKYLSENPDQAQAILEAEDRRAEAARAAGDQQRARVRDGVVQAAQAAAAHFASQ